MSKAGHSWHKRARMVQNSQMERDCQWHMLCKRSKRHVKLIKPVFAQTQFMMKVWIGKSQGSE